MKYLMVDDAQVAELIQIEASRINNTLDLIASENHPAPSILEATGSIFSAKTVEGYPGKRFHAGCTHVDDLERLAVARAKKLFGAEHANVQPHTGVAATLAVYFSVLEIGDKVLAMKLDHGGHLSHGHPSSITGKCFDFHHYGVNRDTERLDYDEIEELALKLRPRMIVTGASAYSRLIDYKRVAAIAAKISAYTMVDMAHIAGLVAAKVIPGPVPHSDFVTFTMYKTMGGGRGGVILCRDIFAQKIDSAIFPGTQGTPHVNSMAAKAVCFNLAMQPNFKETQKTTLANATGLAREMVRHGYRVVFGGTENHTVLMDLRPKGLTGDIAEEILESVGIMTNKNVIPYEPEKPMVTSGLRLGTSAISTRGMGPDEVVRMAELMDRALMKRNDKAALSRVSDDVSLLCSQFPVYA